MALKVVKLVELIKGDFDYDTNKAVFVTAGVYLKRAMLCVSAVWKGRYGISIEMPKSCGSAKL